MLGHREEGLTYIVEREGSVINSIVEALVDAEGEVVVDIFRDSLPLQNELDDSGSD